ncbi:hypothetical protein IMSAG185_01234 [Lachnospiraceae bacterium]|nr:hypothetical protein IMSAG185_01234 [Lachnospiraceae bacterium]
MDLVVHQMMQFQVMHVTDGDRAVKILARSSVAQTHLSVTGDGNALPELSVISVFIEILHHLREQLLLVLLFKLFPLQIDIIIGEFKSIHDIILVGSVEHRRSHVKAQRLCGQGKMNLKYLSDIHTRWHTQRVQHNIQRTSVGQIRHILHGQHAGNHTLVAVTACHLVSHGDLPLLCNIDANCHIYPGGQLIAVFPCKHLGIHHNTILAVRNLQRGISDLSGLLSEYGTQQPLLRSELRLSLGRHLTHQNIAGTHFRSDADDASVVQIL